MEEFAFREGDGVPGILSGEIIPVERNDKEVMELVPDGTPKGFHERGDGREEEREDGFEYVPERILFVDDLVEKGFEADELNDFASALTMRWLLWTTHLGVTSRRMFACFIKLRLQLVP